MCIVYGDNIRFDPERNDYAERQRAVAEIAKLILKSNGAISLSEPANTSVMANIDTGKVEMKSVVGSVNNLFSNEEQIIQLVREAISLIAKYDVIRKLAQVPGHEDIKSVIKKNLQDINQTEDNLGKVNMTLAAINQTRRHSSGFGFFAASKSKTPNSHVDNVIATVIEGRIHCRNDVKSIFTVDEKKDEMNFSAKGPSSPRTS